MGNSAETNQKILERIESLTKLLGSGANVGGLLGTIGEEDENEDMYDGLTTPILQRKSILSTYNPRRAQRQRTLSINVVDFQRQASQDLLTPLVNEGTEVDILRSRIENLEKQLEERDEQIVLLTKQLKEADDTLAEWDQYDALTQNKHAALGEKLEMIKKKHKQYKEKARNQLKNLGVEEKEEDSDYIGDELGSMLFDFGLQIKTKKQLEKEDEALFERRTSATMNWDSGYDTLTSADMVNYVNEFNDSIDVLDLNSPEQTKPKPELDVNDLPPLSNGKGGSMLDRRISDYSLGTGDYGGDSLLDFS